jgi:hypothetical protein
MQAVAQAVEIIAAAQTLLQAEMVEAALVLMADTALLQMRCNLLTAL